MRRPILGEKALRGLSWAIGNVDMEDVENAYDRETFTDIQSAERFIEEYRSWKRLESNHRIDRACKVGSDVLETK